MHAPPNALSIIFASAVFIGCAKPANPTASPDASPVAAPAPADAAVADDARAPTKKLAPLTPPPNQDYRLTSWPTAMRKVGAVVANPAGRPFVEIVAVHVPERVHVEEAFVVRTYFRVLGTTTDDLEIGLHVDGMKARFNGDHMPMAGAYPTSQWKSGELLVDATAARVLHPGSYKVYVFLQMPRTGAIMKVTSGPKEDGGTEGVVPVASFEAE